jgi:glycosyltransferase involved in cell wall biosynthesis
MGDQGRRRACRFYSWRTVAEQAVAIYAAALADAIHPAASPLSPT